MNKVRRLALLAARHDGCPHLVRPGVTGETGAEHRPGQATLTLFDDATLDGGDVLPGFTLPLSLLFAK